MKNQINELITYVVEVDEQLKEIGQDLEKKGELKDALTVMVMYQTLFKALHDEKVGLVTLYQRELEKKPWLTLC